MKSKKLYLKFINLILIFVSLTSCEVIEIIDDPNKLLFRTVYIIEKKESGYALIDPKTNAIEYTIRTTENVFFIEYAVTESIIYKVDKIDNDTYRISSNTKIGELLVWKELYIMEKNAAFGGYDIKKHDTKVVVYIVRDNKVKGC